MPLNCSHVGICNATSGKDLIRQIRVDTSKTQYQSSDDLGIRSWHMFNLTTMLTLLESNEEIGKERPENLIFERKGD